MPNKRSKLVPAPSTIRVGAYWTLATTLALLVNHFLYQDVFYRLLVNQVGGQAGLPRVGPSLFVLTFVQSLVWGVLVGGAQWLILRLYVRQAHWWVVATVAGEAVFAGLDFAMLRLATSPSPALTSFLLLGVGELFVISAVQGLCVGICQWFSVRSWGSGTVLWIPISGVAYLVSKVIAGRTATSLSVQEILSWLAMGLLTGGGMAYMLRQTWPTIRGRQLAREAGSRLGEVAQPVR